MRTQFPPNRHYERSVAISSRRLTLRRERDRHVATLLAMTNWVRVRRGSGRSTPIGALGLIGHHRQFVLRDSSAGERTSGADGRAYADAG